MKRQRLSVSLALAGISFLLIADGLSQESPKVNLGSPSGLDYYAQGGVVVQGVAYFTANDACRRHGISRTEDFPCVVAFDVHTFRKIRTYPFTFTYDSSPLVFQQKDGTWLVIAHEHKKARTVAMKRDTGEVEWISAANQPGNYFFGYSFYRRADGSKLIFMACSNGLHALSSETGEDVWWLRQPSTGGVTPCADQEQGWVFYQCNGKLFKLRAADGEILESVNVTPPNRCISWNTVLVNDLHGYFVASRWYGRPTWDSAIRVYDKDLNLVWERTGLPNGKKDTLTYAEGKLVTGSGNGWAKKRIEGEASATAPPPQSRNWRRQHLEGFFKGQKWKHLYTGDKWKYIAAYSIADGDIVWKCDLSEVQYGSIANLPYFRGYFYGENGGWPPQTTKLFRINAANGRLEEVYDYGRTITSCATHIIAHGKIFSGDLWLDRTVATKIAENSDAEWPGPFGDPQTNQMAVRHEPDARLVPIQELSDEHVQKDGSPSDKRQAQEQ